MKIFACDKCGSIDVVIDDRGNQKALICGDCSKWIKWISKNDLPLVLTQIRNNEDSDSLVHVFKGVKSLSAFNNNNNNKAEIDKAILLLVENGYEVKKTTELK